MRADGRTCHSGLVVLWLLLREGMSVWHSVPKGFGAGVLYAA